MVEKLDCVVVGAGVVGLAVARSFAIARREVVVLEAESRIGMHTSSRNFHLIYPLPSGGGLGIHATNDLAGSARFGPDATWINAIDYAFDESTRERFLAASRAG